MLAERVLIKLEKDNYRLIKVFYDSNSRIFETREILNNQSENIIEKKYISKTFECFEWNLYLDTLVELKTREGFCRIGNELLNNSKMEKNETFNFIFKYDSEYDGFTTKYLDFFKQSIPITLTSYPIKNSFEELEKLYKYLEKKQFDIIKNMYIWYWEEFRTEFEESIEIEKELREDNMYDKSFDELIKIGKREKDDYGFARILYKSSQERSNKFFEILKEMDKIKTDEDKIRLLNIALSINSISIENVSEYDPPNTKYGDILFYFDSILDEEHGANIKLKNGESFELFG